MNGSVAERSNPGTLAHAKRTSHLRWRGFESPPLTNSFALGYLIGIEKF